LYKNIIRNPSKLINANLIPELTIAGWILRKYKRYLFEVKYTIYFNKKGWAKVEIAVGQGKKLYDKREDIKKREIKREINRSIKHCFTKESYKKIKGRYFGLILFLVKR